MDDRNQAEILLVVRTLEVVARNASRAEDNGVGIVVGAEGR